MLDKVRGIIRSFIVSIIANTERANVIEDATNAALEDISTNGLNAEDKALIQSILTQPEA